MVSGSRIKRTVWLGNKAEKGAKMKTLRIKDISLLAVISQQLLATYTTFKAFLSFPRYNYSEPSGKRGEDLKDVIMQLLGQSTEQSPYILEKSQRYIREFSLRSGNQPSIVAYLNQTLKDLEKYCSTQQEKASPLVVDTTLNISEFYFMQRAYMNLSLDSKKNGKHPWFPVHQSKTEEDF